MTKSKNPDDLRKSILRVVNHRNYQPLKPRAIAKKLGLSPEETKALRLIVKKLAKEGQLSYGAGHMVRAAENAVPPAKTQPAKTRPAKAQPSADKPADKPSARKTSAAKRSAGKTSAARSSKGEPSASRRSATPPDRLTGVFRRIASGNGYVRPAGAAADVDRRNDVFIAGRDSQDAASGDVVLVKLKKSRGRAGKAEGLVLEILERETHRFVGTLLQRAGQAYVQVDGTLFADPVAVDDPGAKNAGSGDKVVFEMVRFPSHTHEGEGVLLEVLGPRGKPGVDTLSIMREFDLPESFSDEVLDDARSQAERFDETVPADRDDLTGETVLTIDPVDARDFDDAISLEKMESGHWRLGVHIADVSHFVSPGGPLDAEAYRRATSVYLPDRVIPMIPETISNALASLQPDRVRFTKTCYIEFTPKGVRVDTQLHRAAIRSARRFTYEEVDDFLENRQHWREKLSADVHGLLSRMHELAMILRRRRFKRGALELSLHEVRVDLDREGRVKGAHTEESSESHQIIEEFMLAANEAVADRLKEDDRRFLRRVHPSPSPRKLKALTEFVRELGIDVGNLQDRFQLQALLKDSEEMTEQRAIHYAVLRSLPQAVYSPMSEGHFALASNCYCHFTSPIRRYPDLTIHRLIDDLIAGKKPRNDEAALVKLGDHCSTQERRAEAAERELTKLKLLEFFDKQIGQEMDAVVTGVEEFGLFVQGTQIPAEGLIHVTSLQDDYYDYDKATHTLAGRRAGNRHRLGDLIRVRVARVDLERRQLDFRLVAGAKPKSKPKAKSTSGKKKGARKIKASRAKSLRGKQKKRKGGAVKARRR